MINIEKQSKEAFTWYVAYDDRTTLSEDDASCFADVDQAHITELMLLRPEGWAPHRVEVPHGATAVFFRRRQIVINATGEQESSRPTIHCIGWQRGDDSVYLFVMSDGTSLLTSNLQAV